MNEKSKAYGAEHKEQSKLYREAYRAINRDKINEKQQANRASKNNYQIAYRENKKNQVLQALI